MGREVVDEGSTGTIVRCGWGEGTSEEGGTDVAIGAGGTPS